MLLGEGEVDGQNIINRGRHVGLTEVAKRRHQGGSRLQHVGITLGKASGPLIVSIGNLQELLLGLFEHTKGVVSTPVGLFQLGLEGDTQLQPMVSKSRDRTTAGFAIQQMNLHS